MGVGKELFFLGYVGREGRGWLGIRFYSFLSGLGED